VKKLLFNGFVAGLVLMLAFVMLKDAPFWNGPQVATSETQASPIVAGHQPITATRTLFVTTSGESLSVSSTELSAVLESGNLPAAPTSAVVLSDLECTPDAQGVSHCLNELRLESGETLTVRHNHRMHDVPCLQPGEVVQLLVRA